MVVIKDNVFGLVWGERKDIEYNNKNKYFYFISSLYDKLIFNNSHAESDSVR